MQNKQDLKLYLLANFICFSDDEDGNDYEETPEGFLIEVLYKNQEYTANSNHPESSHTQITFNLKSQFKEKMIWIDVDQIAYMDDKFNYKIINFDDALTKILSWKKKINKIGKFV